MNEEQENGMIAITAVAIFVIMLICALCSCGSKKKVVETVITHDTLVVVKSERELY